MRAGRVVALGEVLVDFVAAPSDAAGGEGGVAARFGGSPANIVVGAARFGARSAFLGAAGADRWGRWLARILAREGVDLAGFRLLEGVDTPSASVTLSAHGEPSFRFRGDREECVASAAGAVEPALLGGVGAFVFGSDTLIGDRERELTLGAQRLARQAGWTVVYDPNLRGVRWSDEATMLAAAAGPLASSSVVKLNRSEAMGLTGAGGPEAAAEAILGAGPSAVVVTLGSEGALLATDGGGLERIAGSPAKVVDSTGAGDSVTAVLAAALAAGADPARLRAILELAVDVAARVVGSPGALDGLPAASEARPRLAEALGGG
jgi:fructokinase